MNPYIHINFACSLDGKIAMEHGIPYKFSSVEDMRRVHKLRSESDAILVGKNTINNDDPKLVVNPKYYHSDKIPDAVILDSSLGIKRTARIFNYNRRVILITGNRAPDKFDDTEMEAKVLVKKCNSDKPEISCIKKIFSDMGYRRILVEGGKSVLTSFISSGYWDEITIFYAPVFIGNSGVPMVDNIDEIIKFNSINLKPMEGGFLLSIKR